MSDLKADSDMELPAEHPISEASKFSSISATVVPNPNDRGSAGNREGGQSGGLLGNLRQVTDGKSMWNVVKKYPLHFAVDMDVSTPKGLADHAETLSDYLYDYGAHPLQRSKHSLRFFDYLLSACWEKLHRRFCSWRRLGLIRNFEERVDLLNGHLDMIGTSAGPNKDFMVRCPGDRTLTHFLYLNRESVFGSMLPSALPSDIRRLLPQSIFYKLREAVVNAFDKNDLAYLYTKETALDFHYLVYCVFLLAGQAIRKIKDHQVPLKQAGAKKNKASYASLVEVLKSHISAAVLPMKFLHSAYWCLDKRWRVSRRPIAQMVAEGSQYGVWEKATNSGRIEEGPSEESPTEDGKEDGDDDDDDAPEMSGVSGLQMFFGWVRTFVAQFLGKRNLEVYTAQLASVDLNKRPEIRVFSVNSELYRVPAWKEFEKVIQNALVDTSENDTAEIIRSLLEKVTSGKGLKPEAQRSVGFFRKIVEQERKTCVLLMHCEAVVAALLESRRSQPTVSSTDPESNDYDILAELSENLSENMVSVSKLCCPVCWELFHVLEMGDVIRGCHPTVTPIVLPETLPNHVSNAMVTRFRAHLSNQLRHLSSPNMVLGPTTGHHRNTSESGYSATSSNEGAKQYSDAYQHWLSVQNSDSTDTT